MTKQLPFAACAGGDGENAAVEGLLAVTTSNAVRRIGVGKRPRYPRGLHNMRKRGYDNADLVSHRLAASPGVQRPLLISSLMGTASHPVRHPQLQRNNACHSQAQHRSYSHDRWQ